MGSVAEAPTISTIQQREYVQKGDKKGVERAYAIDTLKGSAVTSKTKHEMAGSEKGKLLPTDIVLYQKSEATSEYNYPQGDLDAHYPLITKDIDNRQMSIKFRINGTQDLLAGKADRETGYKEGFSAKSARRGVKPNIKMNHMLTRLTFDIYRGDEEANKIQITGIKIKSKDSGKLLFHTFLYMLSYL